MTKCGGCAGRGTVRCPQCSGSGRKGGVVVGNYECPNCRGSGVKTCGACNGKGYV
jgi:hypothetical protein